MVNSSGCRSVGHDAVVNTTRIKAHDRQLTSICNEAMRLTTCELIGLMYPMGMIRHFSAVNDLIVMVLCF